MDLNSALESYLEQLKKAGAISPSVLKSPSKQSDLEAIQSLYGVKIPPELTNYLQQIDGYDREKCAEFNVSEPSFAWGLFPLALSQVPFHYDGCLLAEDGSDYWPVGFIPILWGGSGDFLLVNCIESSPTYGAVYDMSEGVGCNRLADSLAEFFSASEQLIAKGIIRFDEPEYPTVVDLDNYLANCAKEFGNTPYFQRAGKMGTQIVDWHPE